MDHHSTWLLTTLIFFAAAVLAVPLARAMGLGAIIGYLVAGLVIGPSGLGLVARPETVLEVAEFGVVLMLFLVGLELEPRRLWALRRPIFGWGTLQVLACTAVLMGAALALGASWRWALVGALGLALSSTAIALQVLGERNLLPTPSGQAAFAILLFQDVAAIPILALLPLLADTPQAAAESAWLSAGKAVGVIAAVVLIGRLLLRFGLRWVAKSRTPELFTAASLGLVVGIAALMQSAGLSMALGAFLGGVLLAESEYKRELETDVEPFKGLLLGLFFMAVGMSVNLAALAAHPAMVAGLLVLFLGLKAAVLLPLAKAMGLTPGERPVFTLMLAQGGEFAFVVFQQAGGAGVLTGEASSVLVGTVALSMLASPLLLVAMDRWLLPRYAQPASASVRELDEPQEAPILILGFGRYGQVVARLLYANGLKATVLDHDPQQIEVMARFGFRIHYGDATRLDLLRTAGAAQARVIVLAIDDVEQSLAVAALAREHFPQATVVARARNVQHYFGLRERGVALVERETLDAALMTGRSVLETLGWHPHQARQLAMRFRRHNVAQVERMRAHRGDPSRMAAIAKEGRAQLEELFAQERAQREERRREGWGS
jgi:glutathione-regulated potassium-efflux system ancillary protein KefC